MSVEDYRKKRDFSRTSEPTGNKAAGKKAGGTRSRRTKSRAGKRPIFVIQAHDATTLHYDFRLEVDGVLKSWAVPKGPSTDPRDKRLAIATEDHPLDYAGFEGVIPQGEYGGGAVLIWDTGAYDNITEKDGEVVPLADALARGHALVRLHGEKISGGYALQRTGKGEDARWLLVKMKDEAADARRNPVSTQPKSVASRRTLDEIAAEENDDEGEEEA